MTLVKQKAVEWRCSRLIWVDLSIIIVGIKHYWLLNCTQVAALMWLASKEDFLISATTVLCYRNSTLMNFNVKMLFLFAEKPRRILILLLCPSCLQFMDNLHMSATAQYVNTVPALIQSSPLHRHHKKLLLLTFIFIHPLKLCSSAEE